MIRRPPRSTRTDTLFPYTTLFRSRLRWCRAWYQHPAAPLSDPARRLAGDDWTQGAIPVSALHPILGFAPLTLAGAAAMTFGAAYVRGLTGFRSEERRVGKECVSTCSSRWAPYL